LIKEIKQDLITDDIASTHPEARRKKMEVDLSLACYKKFNSKWIRKMDIVNNTPVIQALKAGGL
jgi:hypothetical protein